MALNASADLSDYWTQQYSDSEAPSGPALDIEIIEGIEPLDAQFGVLYPKTVPDPLYQPLFGQPKPTEDDLEQAGGDPAKVPPLHTYAILDAAKVPGLPELLAASGLEHCCLFGGDAFEDLAEVAPWIVRLEEGGGFTRNLFTRSDALWHLWGKEPGIYLRSSVSLEGLQKHFRKFTKLYSAETNSWRFFRFYTPEVARTVIASFDERQFALFGMGIELIACPARKGRYCILRPSIPSGSQHDLEV